MTEGDTVPERLARMEERQAGMERRLDTIARIGWGTLSLVSGAIVVAFVNFALHGGLASGIAP